MGMGRRIYTWLNDGVDTLDDQLSAGEAQQLPDVDILTRGILYQEYDHDDELPNHGCDSLKLLLQDLD
jgi:hypothetical protein